MDSVDVQVPKAKCVVVDADRAQGVRCDVDHFVLLRIKACEWFTKGTHKPGFVALMLEETGDKIYSQEEFLYYSRIGEVYMLLKGKEVWKKGATKLNLDTVRIEDYDSRRYHVRLEPDPRIPATPEMVEIYKKLAKDNAYKNRSAWIGFDEKKLEEIIATEWAGLYDHVDVMNLLYIVMKAHRILDDLVNYGHI